MQPDVAEAERRKATASATDSGDGRPDGHGPAFSRTATGAKTGPGATALTLMPLGASSAASDRVSPMMACLVED